MKGASLHTTHITLHYFDTKHPFVKKKSVVISSTLATHLLATYWLLLALRRHHCNNATNKHGPSGEPTLARLACLIRFRENAGQAGLGCSNQ